MPKALIFSVPKTGAISLSGVKNCLLSGSCRLCDFRYAHSLFTTSDLRNKHLLKRVTMPDHTTRVLFSSPVDSKQVNDGCFTERWREELEREDYLPTLGFFVELWNRSDPRGLHADPEFFLLTNLDLAFFLPAKPDPEFQNRTKIIFFFCKLLSTYL